MLRRRSGAQNTDANFWRTACVRDAFAFRTYTTDLSLTNGRRPAAEVVFVYTRQHECVGFVTNNNSAAETSARRRRATIEDDEGRPEPLYRYRQMAPRRRRVPYWPPRYVIVGVGVPVVAFFYGTRRSPGKRRKMPPYRLLTIIYRDCRPPM